MIEIDTHPLNVPTRAALAGPHRHLALVRGRATRYHPDVSPFASSTEGPLPPGADDAEFWADLAVLLDGGTGVLPGPAAVPPPGWQVTMDLPGVQMIADGVSDRATERTARSYPTCGTNAPIAAGRTDPDPIVEALGPSDVADMLALVARTRPGPFGPRTVEMGTYLGVRHEGALVAMAGERLRLDGFTEISAVCTDPAVRRRGLAGRLVRAVAAGIRARGETPFLHATATNTGAIRLYEALGFRLRTQLSFVGVRAPAANGHPTPAPDPSTDPGARR